MILRAPWTVVVAERRCYLGSVVEPLKAHVHNGRLLLDEPTELPEGEVVELVPLDEVLARGGDYLDDEESCFRRLNTIVLCPRAQRDRDRHPLGLGSASRTWPQALSW